MPACDSQRRIGESRESSYVAPVGHAQALGGVAVDGGPGHPLDDVLLERSGCVVRATGKVHLSVLSLSQSRLDGGSSPPEP